MVLKGIACCVLAILTFVHYLENDLGYLGRICLTFCQYSYVSSVSTTESLRPGANVIKLFTAVIYKFSLYARVFVLDKPFHSCLIFVGKGEAFPRVEQLKCTLLG